MKLKNEYEAGELFASPDKPKLKQDADLDDLLKRYFLSLGEDLKRHIKSTERGAIRGRILHNVSTVVEYCSECTCHVGVHNWDAGVSYYLGSYAAC